MLRKNTNLIIVNNRVDSFKVAKDKNIDLLLFDDGLQDRNLDYDLKFVCFKTSKWIGNGQLIPAGPLRESLTSIVNYDAIFLNSENSIPKLIIDNIRLLILLLKFLRPIIS